MPGTHLLDLREEGHSHESEGHAQEDESDHTDEADAEHAHEGAADHAGESDAEHAHEGEEGHDPHAWLDPQNGQLRLGLIAEKLAVQDPSNAALYRANAVAGQAELAALQSDLTALLQPMQGQAYVTLHDAYQYFEVRFGLHPLGSVSDSDAANPGPNRVARLRIKLAEIDSYCAFSVSQFDPSLLQTVTGRDDLRLITLDPVGVNLPAVPELYPAMLRPMVTAFADCANGQ